MRPATLRDLFVNELKDLFDAENQVLKALPRMIKAASSEELKSAFNDHMEKTRNHVNRLQKIFQKLETSPKGKRCKGMFGVIQESKEWITRKAQSEVLDAGLI